MKYLFFVILLFPYQLRSQNLIPNGSFEDTLSCPFGTGQINKCQSWIRVTGGSPDYFHPCSAICGVPFNTYGNQQPQDGDAYTGLGLGAVNWPGREYMGTSLTDSLKTDSCYHFEMYASLSNCNLTSYNVQIFLSDTFYQDLSYGGILFVTPQLQNPPINTFDTLNWTLFSGDFIAHGGEKHIIIGNFYPTSIATYDTLYNVFGPNYSAYIYIDNVSLIASVCTSVDDLEALNDFSVYPNPATGMVTIESMLPGNYDVVIYDALLQQVYNTHFVNNSVLYLEHLSPGFYTYRVSNSKGKTNTGKILLM